MRRTFCSSGPSFAAPWLVAVVLQVACCARLLSARMMRPPADGVIGSADRAADVPIGRGGGGDDARYSDDDGRYFVPELSNPRAPDPDAVELHELRCADCRQAAAREDDYDDDDDGGGGRFGRTERPKNDGGRSMSKIRDHRRHRVPNASGGRIMDVTAVRKTLQTQSTTTQTKSTTTKTQSTTTQTQSTTTQTPLATHSPVATNRVFNVRWNNVIKKTTKTQR